MEKLQKLSDPPLVDCPACGKPALSKLISAAGFRLKGGGWYETDFKKDGKRNLAGDAAKTEKSGGGGEGAGADAKTDTKSESKKAETKSDSKAGKAAADKAA